MLRNQLKNLNNFVKHIVIEVFRTQSRDRTGMEVNPLVFETSASTNSAIWAIVSTKVRFFLESTNDISINNSLQMTA